MYRLRNGALEVFLAHPGGPVFENRDDGVWAIPKGMPRHREKRLATARREFTEETSFKTPKKGYLKLGRISQKRKHVQVWAFAGDCNAASLRSNTCRIEWPPKSGKYQEIPEMDRGDWFSIATAQVKIRPVQRPLLGQLEKLLKGVLPAAKKASSKAPREKATKKGKSAD